MEYTGKSAYHTGDINLASALMACGIPLDPETPVRLIESGNGSSYGSFRVGAFSEDGQEDTMAIMHAWAGRSELRADHPVPIISEFIRAKPFGCTTSADWLGHAIDWLREREYIVHGVRCIEDIPFYVKPLPQSVASYILAYVYNRETCFRLYNEARRAVHMRDEDRHVLIDSHLPKWQRNELLSRFQG
jgi:hypothetical protein